MLELKQGKWTDSSATLSFLQMTPSHEHGSFDLFQPGGVFCHWSLSALIASAAHTAARDLSVKNLAKKSLANRPNNT